MQLTYRGKGFKCFSYSTKIVEIGNAKFLMDHGSSGSNFPRKVDIQE